MRLLFIPWTALRSAQGGHNLYQRLHIKRAPLPFFDPFLRRLFQHILYFRSHCRSSGNGMYYISHSRRGQQIRNNRLISFFKRRFPPIRFFPIRFFRTEIYNFNFFHIFPLSLCFTKKRNRSQILPRYRFRAP